MSGHDELKDKMYDWTEKYANKAGYRLNPDKEALDYVLDGLASRVEKFGRRYCPCRIVTGDENEDKKNSVSLYLS
nr:ferredoxin-thioredoxin reductase catalytic domain-containing protein [Methanosarcina horonobensis]